MTAARSTRRGGLVASGTGTSRRMSELPAGGAIDAPQVGVHAIDGDGGSLCGLLEAGAAAQIDSLFWSDIAVVNRCQHCQLLMIAYGMGHL